MLKKFIQTVRQFFTGQFTARHKCSTDARLIFALNKTKIPSPQQLKYLGRFLNKSERRAILVSFLVILAGVGFLGANFYRNHIVLGPARGGAYAEILTGTPNFINPLYASINTVDSDLVSLIYSGLLRRNNNNDLVPDLAEKFAVSPDGKTYTFNLKQNVVWHDGKPFSADDVIFTFQALTNPAYASPLQRSFEGIEVARVDEYTVTFTLAEPYAAFLELLTVGILPSGLWQQIQPPAARLADLNTKPIGTGPYVFKSLTKDKAGTIRSYELAANENYFERPPYIQTVEFKFTPNFQESINALNDGRGNGVDYVPKEKSGDIVAPGNYNQYYLNQPQFTALFFNQTNLGAASDIRVKQALAYALDKQAFVQYPQHTSVIDSPMLPIFSDYYRDDITRYHYDSDKANALLDQSGWKTVTVAAPETPATSTAETAGDAAEPPAVEPGTWRKKGDAFLQLTITTVDQPETLALAEFIKTSWEALHIKVTLNTVSTQTVQTDVIKPRNYQVLLYGAVLGADPDQYPFWHSSQISANGLNLSNYSNKKIDALLEDARITTDVAVRKDKYRQFEDILIADLPAIFLYTQKYPYLQTKDVRGFDTQSITVPSDRFSNVTNWYIKISKQIVW
jgi:peptide/nickel transport system substrate-binding protein